MRAKANPQPAVWFPAVRAGSGTDVFTERLAAGLRSRGIRAEITWLPLRAEYAPWTVPAPKAPSWANIVHINSWLHPRFVPRGIPILVTVHHTIHDPAFMPYKTLPQKFYHRFWIKIIETINLKRARVVTAVSRHVADQITKSFGRVDLDVIYNGIDVRHTYTPGPLRDPHRPFLVLYVGNWIKRKGVDLLAPIFKKLGPEFALFYTADRAGAHKSYLLPPQAQCIGRPDPLQLVRFYRDADALLFPSRCEGLPLVVIEAMACGLPVIASNIPALQEIIEEGTTGLLCPSGQVCAFARALKILRGDLDLWRQLRHGARRYAEKSFSMDIHVNSYIRFYHTLLS